MSLDDMAVEVMSKTLHGIAMKHCAYCEHMNHYTMDACNLNHGNRTKETDTCSKWTIESSFKNLVKEENRA